MKIINPVCCQTIRRMPCAFTGSGFCCGAVEVHHYYPKGTGNSSQLDVRFNLCPLCRLHHQMAEDGNINRLDVLDAIAERENIPAEVIRQAIDFLVNLDRKITDLRQDALVAKLDVEAVRDLVNVTLAAERRR